MLGNHLSHHEPCLPTKESTMIAHSLPLLAPVILIAAAVHLCWSGTSRSRQAALLGEAVVLAALAVSVGTASFIQPDCAMKVIEGIERYCERHRVSKVSELVGSLE